MNLEKPRRNLTSIRSFKCLAIPLAGSRSLGASFSASGMIDARLVGSVGIGVSYNLVRATRIDRRSLVADEPNCTYLGAMSEISKTFCFIQRLDRNKLP